MDKYRRATSLLLPRCWRGGSSPVVRAAVRLATADASDRSATPYGTAAGHVPPAARAVKPNRVFMLNRQRTEKFDLSEALRALRAYSISTVPETIELALRVNMVLKKNKLRDPFRGTLVYPHPFGTQRKILALIEEKHRDIAHTAGANIVGGEELIAKLSQGDVELDFDLCVATPTLYDKMRHLQKKLRAKMPSPKKGTVVQVEGIAAAVVRLQQSVEFKCSKEGFINMPVGKMDFPEDHIASNVSFLISSVAAHTGSPSNRSLIKSGVLSSTYGPGFPVEILNL